LLHSLFPSNCSGALRIGVTIGVRISEFDFESDSVSRTPHRSQDAEQKQLKFKLPSLVPTESKQDLVKFHRVPNPNPYAIEW